MLDNIISVIITKGLRAVQAAGFGTPLILARNTGGDTIALSLNSVAGSPIVTNVNPQPNDLTVGAIVVNPGPQVPMGTVIAIAPNGDITLDTPAAETDNGITVEFENQSGPGVIRNYRSLTEVAVDYAPGTEAYAQAAAVFAQNPKLRQVQIVTRLQAQTQRVDVTFGALDETTELTVNGITFTYTDPTPTDTEAATFFIDAINNEPALQPFLSSSGTNNVNILSSIPGRPFTVTSVSNGVTITTEQENYGIAEDILKQFEASSQWYTLILASGEGDTPTDREEILQAAATIESIKRTFVAAVRRTAIDFTGIGDGFVGELKALGYNRTLVRLQEDQDQKVAGAFVGSILGFDPGSYTAEYKLQVGIAPVNYTGQETNVLEAQNVCYYSSIAGISGLQNTKMIGTGEWFDVVHGLDFMTARIAENVFQAIASAKKIPYTDDGVAVIEGIIRAQLARGVVLGIFSNDPEPAVQVPRVSTISSQDKQNRLLPDVTFTATLAGAIHKAEIQGTVSV